jgi:hypothetical protein
MEQPTVVARLIHDYREFVSVLGQQIVDFMTVHLHRYITKTSIKQEKVGRLDAKLDNEIGEMCKNLATGKENEKLKPLKNLFITKVNNLERSGWRLAPLYAYEMQHVATEIYLQT